jgi:hypothetical protein
VPALQGGRRLADAVQRFPAWPCMLKEGAVILRDRAEQRPKPLAVVDHGPRGTRIWLIARHRQVAVAPDERQGREQDR